MIGGASVMRLDGAAMPAAKAPRVCNGALARVEIVTTLAAAERPWRELERTAVLTPYQRFDWIDAWQRRVGVAEGATPLIVIGFGEGGEPLFLLPMGTWRIGPFKLARFLGGKHANFNFGPWRRECADAAALEAALSHLKSAAPDLDALALLNQPHSWEGLANPLAALARQPSPSFGYRFAFAGKPYAELIAERLSSESRRQIRKKEARLKRLPGYRYARVTTAAATDHYLDVFFAQKAGRLAQQGIKNHLGKPEIERFLRDACHHGLAAGRPTIELHALDSDDEVLAVYGCINDGRRFCSMFNSYTLSDSARQSPGVLLLLYIIEDYAKRGAAVFDLGVGEADYKSQICDEVEPLFDSFLPLSERGRALTSALKLTARLKRGMKRSPRLMRLAHAMRRLRGR